MIRKVIFTAAIFLVSAVIFVKNPSNGLFNSEIVLIPSEVVVKDIKTPIHQDKLSSGVASWYDFKEGSFAASPYFKKGSILRVTNLANGKFVDVIVNDYGPDKRKHPNRVIDLDRLAFKKIASLELGVVRVKIHHLTD